MRLLWVTSPVPLTDHGTVYTAIDSTQSLWREGVLGMDPEIVP